MLIEFDAEKAFAKILPMLFMIIERFKHCGAKSVAERFKSKGRMLPEGVIYHASWLEPSGARCFQLMEASGQDALAPWLKCWEDLVDFEINPVVTSAEFWAKVQAE